MTSKNAAWCTSIKHEFGLRFAFSECFSSSFLIGFDHFEAKFTAPYALPGTNQQNRSYLKSNHSVSRLTRVHLENRRQIGVLDLKGLKFLVQKHCGSPVRGKNSIRLGTLLARTIISVGM